MSSSCVHVSGGSYGLRVPIFRAFALACFVFVAASTKGAISTWNGNGGNVNWSTAANWTGGAPTSSSATDVIFAGSNNVGTSGTPLNQDIFSPFRLNSMSFSSGGGAFFIGGNPLEFNGGATNSITQNSSSAVSVANNIAASANTTTTITLDGNGTGVLSLGGIISSGVGLRDYAIVKTGSSAFSLTGTNTYAGGTTINGGTLIINSAASLGATTGALTLNAGTLEVSTGFSTTRTITLGNAASTVQIDPSQTYTVTNPIGGTGALNKTGTGTMVLSGANTYTGATAISAGVLNIQNAAALGTTASGTSVSSGAALQVQGGITVGTETLTLNGGGVASDGALRNISSNNSLSGNLTLGSASTIASDSGTLTLSGTIVNGGFVSTFLGSGDVTSGGVISGSGGLIKKGTGTLTLSGANTYTGTTTIGSSGGADGGTLRLSGSGTISNATTTVYGGTLDLNGTTQSITVLALGGGASGSTSVVTIGAGNLNLGNNITYSAANNPNGATISGAGGGKLNLLANRIFTVNDSTAAAADLTISAIIADGDATARSLTKSGGGTLVLTGINTYTGLTQVGVSGADNSTAGTLQLSGSGKISNATVNVVAGTLDLNGTTQTITALNVSAGSSLAGSTATVNIGSGGVLNLGGNVVYAAGAGNAAGVGTISAGTLNLNGTRTFTVNDSTAVVTDMAVSSVIANGSAGSGLTKAGAGTLALTGANTFTGATTISGGTLNAGGTGALAGTSSVTVNAGGTLLLSNTSLTNRVSDTAPVALSAGTGTPSSGGRINAGQTADTVSTSETIGALTLNNNSTIDLASTMGSHFALTAAGTSTLSATAANYALVLNWDGTPGQLGTGSTDRLLFANGVTGFSGGSTTHQLLFNIGGTLYYSEFLSTGGSGLEAVAFTPVPEPSTWIGGGLAFATFAFSQRRKVAKWLRIVS